MATITLYDMDGRNEIFEVSEELKKKITKDCKTFIFIRPTNGSLQLVEVSAEVYALCDEARRARERWRYELRKHRTRETADEDLISALTATEPLEELVFRREQLRAVFQALRQCTPTQRRRFYLYRIMGYTYAEIAGIEDCAVSCVHQSVIQVDARLASLFQDE